MTERYFIIIEKRDWSLIGSTFFTFILGLIGFVLLFYHGDTLIKMVYTLLSSFALFFVGISFLSCYEPIKEKKYVLKEKCKHE